MSKKITKENYERLFKGEALVVDFAAISQPARIKCAKCGKEYYGKKANKLLRSFDCCKQKKEKKQSDKMYKCQCCGFVSRITAKRACPKCKTIFGSTTILNEEQVISE